MNIRQSFANIDELPFSSTDALVDVAFGAEGVQLVEKIARKGRVKLRNNSALSGQRNAQNVA